MANNSYTSPRLYAHKRTLHSRSPKTKRTHFEMGMGYIEPHELGMPRKEFQKLYNHWEAVLADSGFNDIEYRSPSHTGHFTPFFRENGSTATFQQLYDPFKEEYYALAREFDSYMSEIPEGKRHCRWALAFWGESKMYKWLWYLHIEGVPYRSVAKAFKGVESKWLRNVDKIPKSLLRSTCSEFWAHDHTSRILDLFWTWAGARGFKDPRPFQVNRRLKGKSNSSDPVDK